MPRRRYLLRLARSAVFAAVIVLISLGVGILGYHYIEGLSWLDSLLNASMILSSMGPVTPLHTDAGKLFASAYALFSGVAFLTIIGVLFAPVVHRMLHRFHLLADEEKARRDSASGRQAKPPAPKPK